jgi:hypothetical protein
MTRDVTSSVRQWMLNALRPSAELQSNTWTVAASLRLCARRLAYNAMLITRAGMYHAKWALRSLRTAASVRLASLSGLATGQAPCAQKHRTCGSHRVRCQRGARGVTRRQHLLFWILSIAAPIAAGLSPWRVVLCCRPDPVLRRACISRPIHGCDIIGMEFVTTDNGSAMVSAEFKAYCRRPDRQWQASIFFGLPPTPKPVWGSMEQT